MTISKLPSVEKDGRDGQCRIEREYLLLVLFRTDAKRAPPETGQLLGRSGPSENGSALTGQLIMMDVAVYTSMFETRSAISCEVIEIAM